MIQETLDLRIKRNITLTYINDLYHSIDEDESLFDVYLPKDISRNNFGVIPSFIQLFNYSQLLFVKIGAIA